MKSNDYLTICLYLFLSFFLIFLIDYFNNNNFFYAPYENCMIFTNYSFNGIYYGGLKNYLGAIGMYFLKGIGLLAFVWPTIYVLDTNLFKNYLLKANKKNNSKLLFLHKIIFLLCLPVPAIIYDFLPFVIYDYNCSELIKMYNLF